MSRSAKVYIKGIYAGLLTEIDREHYSVMIRTIIIIHNSQLSH